MKPPIASFVLAVLATATSAGEATKDPKAALDFVLAMAMVSLVAWIVRSLIPMLDRKDKAFIKAIMDIEANHASERETSRNAYERNSIRLSESINTLYQQTERSVEAVERLQAAIERLGK